MDVLLTQVPALVGVVLGALATIIATGVSDRTRWRRTQAVRWDEHRLNAYMDYAREVKEIHSLAFRLTAEQRPGTTSPPIEREQGLRLMSEAMDRRTKIWEALLLLGDADTVLAARAWSKAVMAVATIAQGRAEFAEWEPRVRRADEARDRFYAAARASLAVRGGTVAQVPILHGGTE